jgi:hypothetical protein
VSRRRFVWARFAWWAAIAVLETIGLLLAIHDHDWLGAAVCAAVVGYAGWRAEAAWGVLERDAGGWR